MTTTKPSTRTTTSKTTSRTTTKRPTPRPRSRTSTKKRTTPSITSRDISFIKDSLKLHQIDPNHKVGITKKGHGYYHVTLGKAHKTTSWFINSDVFTALDAKFEVNFCAKECNIEATLIKRV